jgi:ABC-type transport system involved in cytochrome c biogenesis permease subunit
MDSLKKLLKPLASLRLTVILLAAAMFLILAGTLAQIDYDIVRVQKQLFHAWWTWIPFGLFYHRQPNGKYLIPGGIPFVGGYTLIAALLINLVTAHMVRFKLTWKRAGIILIHLGLILLLVSECLTANFAREGMMSLTTNMAANYVQDAQLYELAIEDSSPDDHNNVTVIPASMLKHSGAAINDPRVPFDITVNDYYENSQPLGPFQDGPKADSRVNAGTEVGRRIMPIAPFSGVGDDAEKVNVPAAILTLSSAGKSLGTWSVSPHADAPQEVTLPDGKSCTIDLRPVRTYKPYTVKLLKFTHENYLGTDVPKTFASRVRLVDPSRHVDLEALIWMNHPLRYDYQTFYQAQVLSSRDPTQPDVGTVLQIVQNRNSILPYFALGISLVGLLAHFGMTLIRFLSRRMDDAPDRRHLIFVHSVAGLIVFLGVLFYRSLARRQEDKAGVRREKDWSDIIAIGAPLACVLIFAVCSLPRGNNANQRFDLNAFGKLPVNYEGRVMPLDTLARTSLKIIHGRESLDDVNGQPVEPIEWLIDRLSSPDKADALPVFVINNPDVLNAAGLDTSLKWFSRNDIDAHGKALYPELDRVIQVVQTSGSANLGATDQALFELARHIELDQKIKDLGSLYLVPPSPAHPEWQQVADAIATAQKTGESSADLGSLFDVLRQYSGQNADAFNTAVADYHATLTTELPNQAKTDSEAYFNRFDPFTICVILYVGVLLLAVASWLGWQQPLTTAALSLMGGTFALHTAALVWRMILSGRPPVTNLYSSAVFIAWGGVLLCLVLEFIFRNGIGSFVGAAIGFSSLLVASALAAEGDTMEQLRAVLDTNYWLATHVVCITIGYASTFVAGLLAVVYILRGILTTQLEPVLRKDLSRMIYGIVCFALLFSFVGTILGGIWADQSWGRFWGWDAKENGAILIVLCNAIILHARWGGLVRERGVAVLALFGNMVTAWSWFGTNMLGVGLHSYGFTDHKRLYFLIAFELSQFFLILLGSLLPTTAWRSYSADTPANFPPLPKPRMAVPV